MSFTLTTLPPCALYNLCYPCNHCSILPTFWLTIIDYYESITNVVELYWFGFDLNDWMKMHVTQSSSATPLGLLPFQIAKQVTLNCTVHDFNTYWHVFESIWKPFLWPNQSLSMSIIKLCSYFICVQLWSHHVISTCDWLKHIHI